MDILLRLFWLILEVLLGCGELVRWLGSCFAKWPEQAILPNTPAGPCVRSLLAYGVEQDGFEIVPEVLGEEEQQNLLTVLDRPPVAGRRGLLALPAFAELASSDRMLDLVRPHLPGEPLAVRALFFDKTPEANWPVAWHQDLTVALRERVEIPGFSAWTIKQGIPHVQPPFELLQQMLTVRLHLDDVDASNGALRVLPGTHRYGRIGAEQIQTLRAERSSVLCAISAGGALLMRPLLLHASGRSLSAGHRRVLHIEYAGFELPAGLHWQESAGRIKT